MGDEARLGTLGLGRWTTPFCAPLIEETPAHSLLKSFCSRSDLSDAVNIPSLCNASRLKDRDGLTASTSASSVISSQTYAASIHTYPSIMLKYPSSAREVIRNQRFLRWRDRVVVLGIDRVADSVHLCSHLQQILEYLEVCRPLSWFEFTNQIYDLRTVHGKAPDPNAWTAVKIFLKKSSNLICSI